MANLGNTFDANQVEPSAPFVAIPPGEYSMQITASTMEATLRGDGRFLKLELEITDGEHRGRKTYDRLNLENPNQQAVDIARRTLSAICHAVGILTVNDSEQLHFKPMGVKIAVVPRKDKQGNVVPGEMSNEVKGYKPLSGIVPTGTSTPPAQRSGFTPSTTSGGGNAGGSTPPWKQRA